MTVSSEDDLNKLQEIGRIVANTLEAMAATLEPGMTTAELDMVGRQASRESWRSVRPGTCLTIFLAQPASA